MIVPLALRSLDDRRRGPRSRRAPPGPGPRRARALPAAAATASAVTVDAEQTEVGPGRRGGARACPPPPTVASTTDPAGTGCEELDHLPGHHRSVLRSDP